MPLKPSAQRVQDLLAARGLALTVVEMPDSTRTSAEAAAACGCTVAQIGKSMVFRAADSGRPVLAVASGVNRVDEKKLAAALGEPLGRADPDFVRASTGYAIGGVAPIGHTVAPKVYLDADLMALERIWCAAGTPNAVFELTPADLLAITGGTVLDLRKD
ncbi:MAG: YbaK/EbsC family protein [Thalassobaculum sp.]|uniref:YbaK/EbsC family protein n=1 Tax=Thalassobaculum sp. TaxID=2022740 RepID=UPI0032EDFF01